MTRFACEVDASLFDRPYIRRILDELGQRRSKSRGERLHDWLVEIGRPVSIREAAEFLGSTMADVYSAIKNPKWVRRLPDGLVPGPGRGGKV